MSVKNNILKNAAANIFSKFSNTFIRLLQVPLLIHFLGVADLGRWTVLYTIPSWLAFTNLGFGSAGANQISMFIANGDLNNARKVFSTTLAVIFLISILGSIISILIAPFIHWEILLKSSELRHREFYLTVIWMCINIFTAFFYEAFGGIFRAAHKTHIGVLLASTLPWINLAAIYISLHFSLRFDYIALSLLFSNILFLIMYVTLSLKTMPELSFSIKFVQPSQFKYLFRKGFAFQTFPIGNALVIQGNILIIQIILGPAAVALYSTAKTLVNTIKQAMDIISQATWAELSHLIGANDLKQAAIIHRVGVALAIVVSVLGVIVLTIFGGKIYNLWVGRSMLLPFHLLVFFLIPMPLQSLWITSSVVLMASNKHEGLAVRYILAALISSIACVLLTYTLGIEGAAFSIGIMDIILIPYVIKNSLLITNDNWSDFLFGVFNYIKNSPRLIINDLVTKF